MRIVDLKTFLTLPVGTLFAKYEPCIFGELSIKGNNCGETDFFYADIVSNHDYIGSGDFFDALFTAEEQGTEVKMCFDVESRDGCFEPDQKFAVFSDDEVMALIARLQRALRRED